MGWTERINQHWDKLVFVGGASYLLGVTVWLAQQPRWPWNRSPIARETTPAETLSANDSQFIAYLQQSLKQLNEKPNQSPRPSASPSAQANPQAQEPALSTLPLPASFAPQPPAPPNPPVNNRSGVIERYYYPVYPNNPPVPLKLPPTLPMVSHPAPLPVPPALPPKTALSAIPRPLQPQALAPSTPSIAPLVNTKTRYSLLGVLEAGERSSALFNGDNLTQRFQIGEAIGSSGWMLTGVNNQKAILSKGGKTRYLEVGQSF